MLSSAARSSSSSHSSLSRANDESSASASTSSPWPGRARSAVDVMHKYRMTDTMPPRIIFLFSDTGGGHRASANAVAAAMQAQYPGRFEIEMIDPFVAGSRPFLRWAVYRYNWVIKHMPRTYGLLFTTTDNRLMMRTAIRTHARQLRHGIAHPGGDAAGRLGA